MVEGSTDGARSHVEKAQGGSIMGLPDCMSAADIRALREWNPPREDKDNITENSRSRKMVHTGTTQDCDARQARSILSGCVRLALAIGSLMLKS